MSALPEESQTPIDPNLFDLNGKKINDVYRSQREAEVRRVAFDRRMKERFGSDDDDEFDDGQD